MISAIWLAYISEKTDFLKFLSGQADFLRSKLNATKTIHPGQHTPAYKSQNLPEGTKADLSNDAYKLWLASKYDIVWNDTFRQYVCRQRLFDELDAALEHAHRHHHGETALRRPGIEEEGFEETAPPPATQQGYTHRVSQVVDEPVDELAEVRADEQTSETKSLFMSLALAAAIVFLIWWLLSYDTLSTSDKPTLASKQATSASSDQPSDKSNRSVPTEQEELSAAFQVVTGETSVFTTQDQSGEKIIIKPLRLLKMPFGPVLLASREIPDACHACMGAIDIYYLDQSGSSFSVKRRWPNAIEGRGWGDLPDWSISKKFTTYPAIFSEAGYSNMGSTSGWANLTELHPDGPVSSDTIELNGEEYSGTSFDGKIANISKGKSFEVHFTGTKQSVDRYVFDGTKFVKANKAD